MVVEDEINTNERSINQAILKNQFCLANLVMINSYLVAKIVPFDIAGLHLLPFHFLEPYRPKILSLISVTLSYINDVHILPFN